MLSQLQCDRAWIENKYHDTAEPYNNFARFRYVGKHYDAKTGLSLEETAQGLSALSKEIAHLSRPEQKGLLFAYVTDHTRICVDEHDYFVGIQHHNRKVSDYSVYPWSNEVRTNFPKEAQIIDEMTASGASFGWLDFDHTIPDWDSLMTLGFSGVLARLTVSFEEKKQAGTLTEKQEAFYRGAKIEYEAILRLLDRLYRLACEVTHPKAKRIATCLSHLRDGAPQDFFDALQMIYLYFMLSEGIDHYQVRSLGYGLDGTLYPFYRKALADGSYTKEEMGELLGYFLMQWSAIDNYWGQPFYLAGTNADGSTKVNELSHLILQVYDDLGIYNPKIQIKVNPETPKDFVFRALQMIRSGRSSIVFCNEEMITRALMSRGYSEAQARDSAISGCYEYKAKAANIDIGGGYANPLKAVMLALYDGYDTILGKQTAPHTGKAEDFANFADFQKAYFAQLQWILDTFYGAMDRQATIVQDLNPSLMFSATVPNCADALTDAMDSGIDNDIGVLICGLGTAVDALMAVRTLVYEEKTVTVATLKMALESNWQGYEGLWEQAKHHCPKYGNADPLADECAAQIVTFFADWARERRNSHGGRFPVEIHSARAFVIQGEKMGATPDGRYAGEEISKNASPTPGAGRKGVTALIRSATSFDHVLTAAGSCLDVMLHPSAISGEDGLEAFYAILMTYFRRNGGSIHFNIFDVEELKKAQEKPQDYQSLQVRVCGWNALWNNMPRTEQDAYICRAQTQAQ